MPTYVYRCAEGHEFEVRHSIRKDPDMNCPHDLTPEVPRYTPCDLPLERVIQPVGFRTPGDGFYGTGRV